MFSYLPFASCFTFCGGVWALFKILDHEKIAKPRFTKQIADLIESPSSVFSVFTAIPSLFLSTFDAVFTDRLYSFKGFVRSAKISTIVLVFLVILWYLTKPPNIPLWIGPSPAGYAINALVPNFVEGDSRSG